MPGGEARAYEARAYGAASAPTRRIVRRPLEICIRNRSFDCYAARRAAAKAARTRSMTAAGRWDS
ncbi:Uncharacterised protein [Mycobacteroides abscessus subsp. abscessus]|nr:Uncharacterised protein [Mycobacteroides abscessus subsp. abscessus]SIC92957.1 Uncharacterised protein [Mycobacteroides abscessus subsp. abscessus]SKP41996.1 Uncharacterised protein [Mycobacteroides abscessus subsp. abscessus]SLD72350.1 Uncharacterised protein [Mycobacteroides abscessus subsp. abscessus]